MKSKAPLSEEAFKKLADRDRRHLWHPLTQHKTQGDMLGISRAQGVYLYDEEDHPYIDAISSWYTCVYGHCHPFITGRVAEQMKRLDQVVFAGLTHAPAVTLAEALMEVLPANQEKLFFSDNGSTAVEVGVKMALQYHFNQGRKRKVLLAFEEGFHGDTFGAMSVSGLSVYNGPFEDFTLEVQRIPAPADSQPLAALEKIRNLAASGALAAFVYEPLVQGAAAMKTHNREGLDRILGAVREAGALLIADEVMTGFGKTGTCFASEQLTHQPDILCMSKALTAGLLPMGATSCTGDVFNAFYSDDTAKGFFHGHTYTANPLSCTAALAALELFRTGEVQAGIRRIGEWHKDFEAEIAEHQAVAATRRIGVIFALDLAIPMERYGALRDRLYRFFLERGVFLRPLGRTIYLLPPYVIRKEEMETVYQAIRDLLQEL